MCRSATALYSWSPVTSESRWDGALSDAVDRVARVTIPPLQAERTFTLTSGSIERSQKGSTWGNSLCSDEANSLGGRFLGGAGLLPRLALLGRNVARRFGRVHLARSFKCARDLNTEVAQYRRARPRRVVVEENVVAVSAQPRLTANEVPDLPQGRPPRRANRPRRNLAPHRGQPGG